MLTVAFSLGSWLLCWFLEIYSALAPCLMCYMAGVYLFIYFFGVHLVKVIACPVGNYSSLHKDMPI